MKLVDYEMIYHYGCGVTAGFDAAGDGMHSIDLSCPAHLSRIIGNKYANRARHGASNDISFMQLFSDFHNRTIQQGSCVIFNLTQPYRTQHISNYEYNAYRKALDARTKTQDKPQHNDPLALKPVIELQNHSTNETHGYYFNPILANSDNILDIYEKLKYSYMTQDDIAFYFNIIRNIYAADALSKQYNIPIVFIDFYANLMELNAFEKHPISLPNLLFKEKSVIKSNAGVAPYRSKSLHYYSDGYKILAQDVYEMIKDYSW